MAGTCEYPLSNGGTALIDEEDRPLVRSFGKWYRNDSGYAVKKTRIKGESVSLRMHVLINKTPKGLHTDHINGDRLDNRKSNLRTASAAMNAWNRHKDTIRHRYPNLPKGISFDISRNQFVATRTTRRRFDTMEDAVQFVNSGVNEL